MRLVALLMLPSLTFAAPAPKQLEKPGVILTLSAKSPLVLKITIQNNGQDPLELPYRVTPFEHFVVDLAGEKGKQHKIQFFNENVADADPGTLTIPAGKTKTLTLHTCHFLPQLGEPGQKVTFTATLKHNGKIIESKPLTVDP